MLLGPDKKPDATAASTYLLERFVELNAHRAEDIEELKPGLWKDILAAIEGKISAFYVEDQLLTTLNEQNK